MCGNCFLETDHPTGTFLDRECYPEEQTAKIRNEVCESLDQMDLDTFIDDTNIYGE